MRPSIEYIADERNLLRFTLKGVQTSVANALRKTILCDIPCVVFDIKSDKCVFENNRTNFHNEILKERLHSIPVHVNGNVESLTEWAKNHFVEIDAKNTTAAEIIFVTTSDFRLKRYGPPITDASSDERESTFPKNQLGRYIDFVPLKPAINRDIPAQEIRLRAGFMVSSARQNGCFSVVSKCSYGTTRDPVAALEHWNFKEAALRKEYENEEPAKREKMIEFEKRDFDYLDAQRLCLPNSFDFVIRSEGVYSPTEIVVEACVFLQNQCVEFIENLKESPESMIFLSGSMKDYSTMENSYDVLFFDIKSNIGFVIYDVLCLHYLEKPDSGIDLNYCAFKKFHPADSYYTLRLAFGTSGEGLSRTTIENVKSMLIQTAVEVGQLFEGIHKLFVR